MSIAGQRLQSLATAVSGLYTIGVTLVVSPVVIAAHWVAYVSPGWWAAGAASATPARSVALTVLLFALAVVHEIGHLAAAVRHGVPCGDIRVSVHLFPPEFGAKLPRVSTLSRSRRVVIDLAGCWIQLVFVVPFVAGYVASGDPFWLLASFLTDLSVLLALTPTPRSDGYWFFSDAQGFRDMHREFWPTFSGVDARNRRTARWCGGAGIAIFLTLEVTIVWFDAWVASRWSDAASLLVLAAVFTALGVRRAAFGFAFIKRFVLSARERVREIVDKSVVAG